MASQCGWVTTAFLCLCGTALLSAGQGTPQAPQRTKTDLGSVVDLTHVLEEDVPVYPGGEPFRLTNQLTIEKSKLFYMNKFSMGEHTGTHLDAPSHAAAGGVNVDALTLDRLIGPLAVLDVETPPLDRADYAVTLADVRAWENKSGPVPDGAFVVARTGWEAYWKQPKKYVNADKSGLPHFPGFSKEAVKYLVGERKVRGVGIDTLSIDVGASTTFEAHAELLGASKVGVENLSNLKGLPAKGATLVVMPLKIGKGSGGPARVLAVVPPAQN